MSKNLELHIRLTAIFSGLTSSACDHKTWGFVRRQCSRALDVDLPMQQRRDSMSAAIMVFKEADDQDLADALEHHLLVQLSQTSHCPAVEDRLARLLLRHDGVALRPLTFGGRVLSYELGTVDPADAKKYTDGWNLQAFSDMDPLTHWVRGLELAEGLAFDRSNAMDGYQVVAGLQCLAMVILNLHCIPDKKESARLADDLYRTGPELWRRLHRKLQQARREHPEFSFAFSPLRDEVYGALKLRLRTHVAYAHEAPARQVQPHSPPVAEPVAIASTPDAPAVRVLKEPIPPSAYKEDREQLKSYEALAQPMKLRCLSGVDDLLGRIAQLLAEFPWAQNAIEEVRSALEPRLLLGRREFKLPNLLLAGPPGAGKSRLARRLAAVFNLPFVPIPVGGSTDVKMLVGTSRGWASGAPTPLLTSMLSHGTPSGLVLLDELDKGARSTDGGRIVNAVLTFLEQETASNYRDCYLHAACDLSWLSFIGTVNTLRLPDALLSRFRIVYVPEPSPEHRPALAASMKADLASQWGVPSEVLPALPPDMINRAGRSARDLQRCVEDYLAGWLRDTLRPDALH